MRISLARQSTRQTELNINREEQLLTARSNSSHNGLCANMPHEEDTRGRCHWPQRKIMHGIASNFIVTPPCIETSLFVHKVLGLHASVAASELDTLRGITVRVADCNVLN